LSSSADNRADADGLCQHRVQHRPRTKLARGRARAQKPLRRGYRFIGIRKQGYNFYNLVATFETDQSVEHLREKIGAIETAQGRVRSTARYSARTLDIDILLYGALIRHDAEFDIPRGEILEYAYVLAPLAEIAPTARHPENGATFAELWRRLEPKSAVRRVAFDFSD
jgi:2-amino-4-hydroxy-6-hydroxymethyldihydropteridine diphosphokinase